MYMANAGRNARGPNTIYIPPACIGLALVHGGLAGSMRFFLDANMLVAATQKSRVWGTTQHEPLMRGVSRYSGI